MKGRSASFNMEGTKSAVMMPVKITSGVAPCMLIPPHTCTFTGCFGRGLGLGVSPFFSVTVYDVFQAVWKLHLSRSRFENCHANAFVHRFTFAV